MTRPRKSSILDADGAPFVATGEPRSTRLESLPSWSATRHWEAAESNRLNSAHWAYAQDDHINAWLSEHLATIRARSIYESRQNGMVGGLIRTHADDIVGPDGPTLQIESDDDAYNDAGETLWRDWFAAPMMRRNVSGAALLKLWVLNLWRCGEYLARIATDPDADGPVKMRLWPVHPRRLASPMDLAGDPNTILGVQHDRFGRPIRYWISEASLDGQTLNAMATNPWPADLVIHEFSADEEDQARGFPWLTPGLSSAADLRDYDDQVQDAARQQADQSGMFYADGPDVEVWTVPESTSVERRTWKMAPPGWKPFVYPATQPPVQYPDYRAERLREIGRPVGMPLLMIRLDASNHNYSSARLDTQIYRRAVAGIQSWMSGTEHSYGTLNRLLDDVIKEARFTIPELRNRPRVVRYRWTWPAMPHVDPLKEANAEAVSLGSGTLSMTEALATRGRDFESHVATLQRERRILEQAGLPVPQWMQTAEAGQAADASEEKEEQKANG